MQPFGKFRAVLGHELVMLIGSLLAQVSLKMTRDR
jgi:hypothetical protein